MFLTASSRLFLSFELINLHCFLSNEQKVNLFKEKIYKLVSKIFDQLGHQLITIGFKVSMKLELT